ADIYNYNYWSSPVGTPNNTTNNNTYSISAVVRDGNNPASPINLSFTAGFDGAAGPPATLSTRWMYRFDNAGNNINNWIPIGSTGSVQAGKGYIHKGTSSGLGYQNYTFLGKPHNGRIQYSISGGMLTLLGNPYASALDSETFINDNIGSINAAVYFWEHWGGGTHRLLDYQGGYAVLNLSGGVPALSHPDVNQTGIGTVTPGRFIPVGQGFFVIADDSGGTLTFNNNQRAFIREDDTDVDGNLSNYLVRANKPKDKLVSLDSHFTNNSQDIVASKEFKRIRLSYTTAQGFMRQLLLTFTQNQANDAFNNGYDALNLDSQPEDMYFVLDDKRLIIQGVGPFDENKNYPLGIKNESFGKVKIGLQATENLSEEISILIFDKESGLAHNLRDADFEVELTQIGEINDRFRIQFTDQTLSVDDFVFTSDELKVFHTPQDHVLHVQNTRQDLTIAQIQLFDLLGRSILKTDTEAREQSNIEIKLPTMSTGVYLVKLSGEGGSAITRKLIIE
ncbi:MAG: T9SS type A sorting domain-containing protein, partial [Bacteroidetes bacterium]|nr:T9SS type A sorting domain-containing protein [Bacteroidota bacterium]